MNIPPHLPPHSIPCIPPKHVCTLDQPMHTRCHCFSCTAVLLGLYCLHPCTASFPLAPRQRALCLPTPFWTKPQIIQPPQNNEIDVRNCHDVLLAP